METTPAMSRCLMSRVRCHVTLIPIHGDITITGLDDPLIHAFIFISSLMILIYFNVLSLTHAQTNGIQGSILEYFPVSSKGLNEVVQQDPHIKKYCLSNRHDCLTETFRAEQNINFHLFLLAAKRNFLQNSTQ